MQVDVVELDPVVIAAAYSAMGFPETWCRASKHCRPSDPFDHALKPKHA